MQKISKKDSRAVQAFSSIYSEHSNKIESIEAKINDGFQVLLDGLKSEGLIERDVHIDKIEMHFHPDEEILEVFDVGEMRTGQVD